MDIDEIANLIALAATRKGVMLTGLRLGIGGREVTYATDLIARGIRDLSSTYLSVPDFDLIRKYKSEDPMAESIITDAVRRAEREARYR